MSWRLAKSLETLRNQVNAAYPNRSKVSDGTIGDAAHAASASDHNPNRNGVVCALDLTHDPKNGFDAHALAEHLRKNRHPNLRYVISNARIAGAHTGWRWQPSVGHYQHCHVSVGTHGVGDGQTYNNYDSTQAWDIGIKKGGTMGIIRDVDNEWRRWRKLAQQIRGRDFSRAEFKRHAVGKTWLRAMETLSDNAEADRNQANAALGRMASKDKWQQQIYDLQARVKDLGSRPTKAQLDAANTAVGKLSAQMKDAQAEATQARKDAAESRKNLEKIQQEAEQAEKEASNFLTALINAVRKMFGK